MYVYCKSSEQGFTGFIDLKDSILQSFIENPDSDKMDKCNVLSYLFVIKQNTKMYPKYFRLIVILLPLFIISCKKEKTSVSPGIIGTWELRSSFNGQGGATNYHPGNGNYFKFADTTYALYSNNVLKTVGTYKIRKDSAVDWAGQTGHRIIFNNQENSIGTYITISHDTLDLWIHAYDAPSTIFRKTSDDSQIPTPDK